MDKLQQKLRREELRFQDKEETVTKKVHNKSVALGTLVGVLIALTPYLYTLYEYVPDQRVWNNFLFTYESPYYESVYVVAWTLTTKLIPLFLLFIWFFTNRHWWYHALIVPIGMYLYQIIIILNDDLEFSDTNNQVVYLLPLMAIIIPSIYLIRAKMFSKINDHNKTMEELEEEFMMKPKTFWGKVKQYF